MTAQGHNYVGVVTDPTCAAAGYTTYTCSACFDSYVSDAVAATGEHSWDKDRDCLSGHTCTVCNTTEAALGHNYVLDRTADATCTEGAKEIYVCSACGDDYEKPVGEALGHNIQGVKADETHVSGCEYKQTYKCTTCGTNVPGDTVYHHSHVAEIDVEATCRNDGNKIYTCPVCQDS